MPYDYTDAPPRRKIDLIPNTTATLTTHILAGGVGEDGMLTRSTDGGCEMLKLEFTVVDGEHAKRKFWENFILEGTTDGHAAMVERSCRILKAIIDSAYGLDPKDASPEARARRTISLGQIEGMTFMGTIGEERGKPKNDGSGENWDDRNVLAAVITKDKKDWHPVEQPPPFNGGNSGGAAPTAPPTSAPPIARPGWAS